MSTAARVERLRAADLSPDVHGVHVVLHERSSPRVPIVIRGAFRVAERDVRDVEAPIHRSLVLVTQRTLEPAALCPFAEQVLFEEDHTVTHAGIEGAFQLDVFELLGVPEHERAGLWHIFVSLGPHVSNVLEVDIPG